MGKRRTHPITPPGSAAELAWAAGFFDGEGCISFRLSKNKRRGYVTVSAWQSDTRTLNRFRDAVGMGVVSNGRIRHHDPKRDRSKHKREFSWASSLHREVMALLWPYLSMPKRLQAAEKWAKLDAVDARKEALCQQDG